MWLILAIRRIGFHLLTLPCSKTPSWLPICSTCFISAVCRWNVEQLESLRCVQSCYCSCVRHPFCRRSTLLHAGTPFEKSNYLQPFSRRIVATYYVMWIPSHQEQMMLQGPSATELPDGSYTVETTRMVTIWNVYSNAPEFFVSDSTWQKHYQDKCIGESLCLHLITNSIYKKQGLQGSFYNNFADTHMSFYDRHRLS